jgi:hypothetical protein
VKLCSGSDGSVTPDSPSCKIKRKKFRYFTNIKECATFTGKRKKGGNDNIKRITFADREK